jgi:hypothetical protein
VKVVVTIMEWLIGLFVFCLVLFIYLHVTFQLRTSNDLEVYEIDNISKNRLEEVCDIRQPVIFEYQNDPTLKAITKDNLEKLYPTFEIKIRDTQDIGEDMYLPLQFHSALKLMKEDTTKRYISENNSDFLHETGAVKHMKYNDEFVRPYMVSNCNYDIMFGSKDACTPFRYEINYRNYFFVTEGEVVIKLAPPRSKKYLAEYCDYELFEFRSPINPWNVKPEHEADFDKVKCLEVKITPGKAIFIPAYWWYSIKFSEGSTLASFKYRTYMNNMAIIPQVAMFFLQNQNIKHNVMKKVEGVAEIAHGLKSKDTSEEKNDTTIAEPASQSQ